MPNFLRLIIFLLFAFGANSCATLFNSEYRRIEIQSSEPCRIEAANEVWETEDNVANIYVPRSKSPLILRVTPADSFTREYKLPSHMSGTVWLDIAAIPLMGLGLYGVLLDRASPKYYTYDGSLYIDFINDQFYRTNRMPIQQGQHRFGIAMPSLGSIRVGWPDQENHPELGWSFSMFYEYYHRRGTALYLKTGFSISEQVEGQGLRAAHLSIGQRRWAGPLHVGYGLGYLTFYKPEYEYYIPPNKYNNVILRRAIGPVVSAGTRLGPHIFLNLEYQSAVFNLHAEQRWKYSSLWGVELGWRVRL